MELPKAAGAFRSLGLEVMGADVVWFPRCPAAFVTPFTGLMLEWFIWLEAWGKTPFDLGLEKADELDPRYWPAMRALKREVNRMEQEEIEAMKRKIGSE